MFKKVLFIVIVAGINVLFFISVSALTDLQVDTRITNIQGSVPAGTPDVPSGQDQKGYIGSVIANIFDATQKIKSYYILGFRDILGATYNNNVPKWNGEIFKPGTINDVSGRIGIGTTNPQTSLHVNGVGRFDGGVQIDGRRAISSTNYSHTARSNVNNHYGYFEVRDNSDQRGAYFGFGNGGDRVDLTLHAANRLYISGGDVGIATTNPQARLHVNGNIIASNPTQDNHVATKSYVDSIGGGGGAGDNLGNHIATKNLNMSGRRIEGVANPNSNDDAVNKGYVDTLISGIGSGEKIIRYNSLRGGPYTTNVEARNAWNNMVQKTYDNHPTAATVLTVWKDNCDWKSSEYHPTAGGYGSQTQKEALEWCGSITCNYNPDVSGQNTPRIVLMSTAINCGEGDVSCQKGRYKIGCFY